MTFYFHLRKHRKSLIPTYPLRLPDIKIMQFAHLLLVLLQCFRYFRQLQQRVQFLPSILQFSNILDDLRRSSQIVAQLFQARLEEECMFAVV